METQSNHPFVAIAREFTQALLSELRRSFLRLTTTLITMIAGTVMLITVVITTVVVAIVHLFRGMVTLAEQLVGQSWCAEISVGVLMLLITLLVTVLLLRGSKCVGNDAT